MTWWHRFFLALTIGALTTIGLFNTGSILNLQRDVRDLQRDVRHVEHMALRLCVLSDDDFLRPTHPMLCVLHDGAYYPVELGKPLDLSSAALSRGLAPAEYAK